MVYKKYIKRNGKIYGPYIYHSKRIDGKVISEYHGQKKDKRTKKLLLIFLGIAITFFLAYTLIQGQSLLTGKAVLEINAEYKENETLKGKINLNLKKGELIPKNSKLIFENNEKNYEFNLEEIISSEIKEGYFFLEGKEITGSGEGYGSLGTKTTYPEINFILNIYKQENNEESTNSENSQKEEVKIEEQETQENETENNLEEEQINENQEPEKVEDSEEIEEPENNSETITGNIIRRISRSISNLFLTLNPTGQASLELEKEINGVVSKNNDFIYEFEVGESVELKPLSVEINGEKINDNEIKLNTEENKVTITTEYETKKQGFGKEYIEEEKETISIDLEKLNLSLIEGELKIKIIYEENQILELTTNLENEKNVIQETQEVKTENTTEEIKNINETVNESKKEEILVKDLKSNLTIEEKAKLLTTFGNIQIETIKSELINNRIIVVYKIGEYEIEYSYDSSLSNEILELQMQKDRNLWLKDISKTLLEKESETKQLEEFKKNFDF